MAPLLPTHPKSLVSSTSIGRWTTVNPGVQDFPGGLVVKSPPANAGDMGSTPGPGRFHTSQNNSARAPHLSMPTPPRACALQKQHCHEKTRHHNQRAAPLTVTRESLCMAMNTQCSQKQIFKNLGVHVKYFEMSPPKGNPSQDSTDSLSLFTSKSWYPGQHLVQISAQ